MCIRDRYMAGQDAERLHGAMVHSGAELGFLVDSDGEMECIWRDRYIREGQRIALFRCV